MTEQEYSEWVICGRPPTKKDGRIDLYKIERALRDETDSKRRVDLLKRVVEAKK